MAGATARPVSRDQIQKAKLILEQAVKRMQEALEIMLDASIDEIDVRAHVALTKGVKAVSGMAADVKAKAEDKQLSQEMGVPTKSQINREHHATYGKPKSSAPKKAKSPSKRTEST